MAETKDSRAPLAAMGYRWDKLVRATSELAIEAAGEFTVRKSDGSRVLINSNGAEVVPVVQYYGVDYHLCAEAVPAASLNKMKGVYRMGYTYTAIVGDDNTVICSKPPFELPNSSSPVASELTHVEGICASNGAVAALKQDGTVATWGDKGRGGDSSSVQSRLKGVKEIYSNNHAFAAVLDDGTVETWGIEELGGLVPPAVKGRLKQVQYIVGTASAFSALLSDGTVETWGSIFE